MILTGKNKEYYFLQIMKDGYDFNKFALDFSDFLIGKAVGILSFDGDSMKPTKEEYQRGWTYDEQEVAYFKSLNKKELNENIFANCYDEWYLFDELKPFQSNNIFVTLSGFRLIDLNKSKSMENLQNSFWKQVELNNPSGFVINGDNFIYGSKNESEIKKIIETWK